MTGTRANQDARAAPARVAALRVYETVAQGSGTLPDALAVAQASLEDARDRALTAEIVSGTFRWQAALDCALAGVASRPLDQLDPRILGILRLSAYQLLFLDRVPAHAVVFDAVTLAREGARPASRGGATPGAAGFVNAVLRKLTQADRATRWPPRPASPASASVSTSAPDRRDEALTYLAVTLSHPRWLAARWLDRHGFDAAEAWAHFDNVPAPLTLRANTLRLTRDDLRQRLADLGVVTEPTPFAPDGLIVREGQPLQTPLAREGLFTTQDEASQLVACLAQAAIPWPADASAAAALAHEPANLSSSRLTPLTPPTPSERASDAERPTPTARPSPRRVRVLDACASPGGKTVALAAAIGARGVVIATDRRRRRLRLLAETVRMTGVSQVRIAQLDLEVGLPFRDAFDLVLVDAPCSGLGTLRREPEIRWRRTDADLAALAARQRLMLAQAATGVRPGGRLVYATCSSEPDENEAVATAFLDDHPSFRPLPAHTLPLPPTMAAAIDGEGHLRTWPFAHGLEAFFAAVFERVA